MKAFKIVLSVLLIVALVGMIAVIIFVKSPSSNEELKLEESSKPEYETTFGFVPETLPTDETELIRLAARMYDVANRNTQDLENVAFIIKYNSTISLNLGVSLPIPIQGYRYQLKNGTEYYATEYAIPGSSGLGGMAGQFSKENSHFASRSYGDASKAEYLYSQKSYAPSIVMDEKTNEPVITSDFSEKNLVPEKLWSPKQPLPYYCSVQSERFYAANRSMSENNILSASIEKCKGQSGDYYRLIIELDVTKEETWERTIDELRQGTAPDGHYTSMTEIIDIWENGYYKSFRSLDKSEWKKGGFSMDFDYNTYYFYDDAHTTPTAYSNFAEAKQNALAFFAAEPATDPDEEE